MAETLLQFIPHQDQNRRAFNLTLAMLRDRQEAIPMGLLLLYFSVWMVRLEGLLFGTGTCSSCRHPLQTRAWVRTDFRGLLCPDCRTDESHDLTERELLFVSQTARQPAHVLEGFLDDRETARLSRLFIRKIEYHGEFRYKSTQYLPIFR
jgi:recombinational DNA repair protein (RecF pathway)